MDNLTKLTEEVISKEKTRDELGDQVSHMWACYSALVSKYKEAEKDYMDACAKRAEVLEKLKKDGR